MGKGGMLSAQKKLLEATVAETGAQLQQQELTYLQYHPSIYTKPPSPKSQTPITH